MAIICPGSISKDYWVCESNEEEENSNMNNSYFELPEPLELGGFDS